MQKAAAHPVRGRYEERAGALQGARVYEWPPVYT